MLVFLQEQGPVSFIFDEELLELPPEDDEVEETDELLEDIADDELVVDPELEELLELLLELPPEDELGQGPLELDEELDCELELDDGSTGRELLLDDELEDEKPPDDEDDEDENPEEDELEEAGPLLELPVPELVDDGFWEELLDGIQIELEELLLTELLDELEIELLEEFQIELLEEFQVELEELELELLDELDCELELEELSDELELLPPTELEDDDIKPLLEDINTFPQSSYWNRIHYSHMLPGCFGSVKRGLSTRVKNCDLSVESCGRRIGPTGPVANGVDLGCFLVAELARSFGFPCKHGVPKVLATSATR